MNYRGIKDYYLSKIKFGPGFKKEYKSIQHLYSYSEPKLFDLKNEEFVKLYRNAFSNSKFYNQLYKQHGLNQNSVQSLDDIEKIPVITKDDIRNCVDDLLTVKKMFVYKAFTSGTSGSPLQLYRDYPSVCKEYAYGYYFEQLHGYQLGDKVISIKGDMDKNSISRFDRSLNVLHLSSYNLNEKNIRKYFDLIREFEPKVITAYPSSLQILSTELYKQGLELHIPIAFTSSEVLHNFQRNVIEKVLHSQIFDWYGNAERTIALQQIKKELYQDVLLYGHIEAQENSVITTGFINKSFPLIRYRVDDVIKLRCDGNCSRRCVSDILGRDNQYILLKNGQQIGLLDHAFNFNNINNFLAAQIVQKIPGEIDLNIIPTKSFTEKNKNELLKNLMLLVGEDCKIHYHEINEEQIIRTRSGKFNLMVSCLETEGKDQIVKEILNEN